MTPTVRSFAAWALAGVLSACAPTPEPPAATSVPALESFVAGNAAGSSGRAWDGVVEAVRQADLAAQTGGRVAELPVDAGDRVKAGQLLLRLTDVEQSAGAAAARAQLRANEAAASEAQANYARYAALGQKQFVSALQLEQARAARDAAVANRDAARAQLAQAARQADYTVVRAPFDGVIRQRRVEAGETVSPGQPLLSLYVPGAVRVVVELPQAEAEAVRTLGRATVRLDDGRSVEADSLTVFPAADAATHTVTVRAMLAAAGDLPAPGSAAKLVFALPGGATPTLRVPRSAVVQRGELSAVYVLQDGRIALRQLRLGAVQANDVDVLSGLKAGERVAADPVAAGQALAAQRKARAAGHD
jgi:RND family efflux transporter MFP subunit